MAYIPESRSFPKIAGCQIWTVLACYSHINIVIKRVHEPIKLVTERETGKKQKMDRTITEYYLEEKSEEPLYRNQTVCDSERQTKLHHLFWYTSTVFTVRTETQKSSQSVEIYLIQMAEALH